MTVVVSMNLASVSAATYTPDSIQTWAVLVCGGSSGGSQQEDFENQIAEAYNTLLSRAYDSDHIYYLDIIYPRDVTGDSVNDVDARSSKVNVEHAITTWLGSHSDDNDVCFLYLVNHGGNGGYFYLDSNGDGDLNDPDDYIRDYEVASWIAQVEYGELIFVLEACFAGDFIDDLSQTGRIIACSTDGNHYAWPDPGTDWPAFSHTFFPRLESMDSIGEAFNVAYQHVRQVRPYQYPILDDNGDGVGHYGPLPNGGDGNLALSICWMPGDCNDDDIIDIVDAVIIGAAYGSHCDPNWDPRADCNEDWVVNYSDVQIIQDAYGSRPGDPNWDPRADCNDDGVVDIVDAVIVGVAYGSSCEPNWDARADLNCDWVIDYTDIGIVSINYGYQP